MEHAVLDNIKRNIGGAERVKAYCSDEALVQLRQWAERISQLQIRYREIFNSDSGIIPTCKSCSMCCQSHVGTGGKLEVSDAFYYSMVDVEFADIAAEAKQEYEAFVQRTRASDSKLKNFALPSMCLFWGPESGCKLPDNARPKACIVYTCSINLPLMQQQELKAIVEELKTLYATIPVTPDPAKLREKK